MGKLYIDRKYFAKIESKWISFESNPVFKRTKKDIYGRCVPCITNLYEQLQEGKKEIRLGKAYQCWKIVVSLGNIEECTQFLCEFEASFLEDANIKGRFGSSDSTKSTKVIVFNAESEAEKDKLYERVKACASVLTYPESIVSYHRACAELYHELLGDWKKWSETETIKDPGMVKAILERIRKTLFWQKEDVSEDTIPGRIRPGAKDP
jgi:hypothetical protein